MFTATRGAGSVPRSSAGSVQRRTPECHRRLRTATRPRRGGRTAFTSNRCIGLMHRAGKLSTDVDTGVDHEGLLLLAWR